MPGGQARPGSSMTLACGPGLGKQGDGQPAVAVHEDLNDLPSRGEGDVDDAERLGQLLVLREQLGKQVGGGTEELIVEFHARVVGIERQVADARLHEVLEKMGPEGHIGNIVALLAGHLDDHGGVVDFRVGDAHPEPDVAAASPPARPHEDELAPGQKLVQFPDGLADRDQAR